MRRVFTSLSRWLSQEDGLTSAEYALMLGLLLLGVLTAGYMFGTKIGDANERVVTAVAPKGSPSTSPDSSGGDGSGRPVPPQTFDPSAMADAGPHRSRVWTVRAGRGLTVRTPTECYYPQTSRAISTISCSFAFS